MLDYKLMRDRTHPSTALTTLKYKQNHSAVAEMPVLKPTIHEFVKNIDRYKHDDVVPDGWRKIENASRWSNFHGVLPLQDAKYSYTKVPRNDNENRVRGWRAYLPRFLGGGAPQEKLLTITIPDLHFTEWWKNPFERFAPPDGVKIIVWQADGYRIQRIEKIVIIPEITFTISEDKVTCEKTDPMDDKLLAPPAPRYGLYRELVRNDQRSAATKASDDQEEVIRPPTPQLKPFDTHHHVQTNKIPMVTLTPAFEKRKSRPDSILDGNPEFVAGRGEFIWVKPMNAGNRARSMGRRTFIADGRDCPCA